MPYLVMFANQPVQIICKDSLFPDLVTEEHPDDRGLNDLKIIEYLSERSILIGEAIDGNRVVIFLGMGRQNLLMIKHLTAEQIEAMQRGPQIARPGMKIPVRSN